MAKRPGKPAAPVGPLVKVQATRLGFFDNARRRPGDVFVVPESAFADKWMEKVDESTPVRSTAPNAALRQEHADLMAGKRPRLSPIGADLLEDPDEGATGDTDVLNGG